MHPSSPIETSLPLQGPTKLNASIVLRSILFNALMILLTVFFSLSGLMIFWSPFKVRYAYITTWSKTIIWLAKTICGVKYQINGYEHLTKENAIVLCNHQSTWETLFLQKILPPQTWVLKKQLLNIPFFGWGLSLLEPIAIDRKKKQSIKFLIKHGIKRLKQGRWVVIFPEGTRVKPGEKKKFSRSGAALATAANYPVIAIAHNAGTYWPKNSFFKFPGTIRVNISEVFDPNKHTPQSLTGAIQDWVFNNS
jgi:1-acyl-sn-glycerol-3-phosphate acyltransferase